MKLGHCFWISNNIFYLWIGSHMPVTVSYGSSKVLNPLRYNFTTGLFQMGFSKSFMRQYPNRYTIWLQDLKLCDMKTIFIIVALATSYAIVPVYRIRNRCFLFTLSRYVSNAVEHPPPGIRGARRCSVFSYFCCWIWRLEFHVFLKYLHDDACELCKLTNFTD